MEIYDGVVAELAPAARRFGHGADRTILVAITGGGDGRHGLRLSVLYMGASRWRRVWPYHAQPEEVSRTLLTDPDPIRRLHLPGLGPGAGADPGAGVRFLRRRVAGPDGGRISRCAERISRSQPPIIQGSAATNAREFLAELSQSPAQDHSPAHSANMPSRTGKTPSPRSTARGHQPAHPRPPFEPAMQIEVPSTRLTDQWRLGAWHILRRSAKDAAGKWHFNDLSFRNSRVGDVHDSPRSGPSRNASGGR